MKTEKRFFCTLAVAAKDNNQHTTRRSRIFWDDVDVTNKKKTSQRVGTSRI